MKTWLYKNRYNMIVLAVLVLIGLIYSNVLYGPPLFDDIGYIKSNAKIHDITDIQSIWKAWKHPSRFVGYFTFAVNYHFHQLDVFGYHVVNILIHMTNTVLIWMIVNILFQSPRLREDASYKNRHYIALLTVILFATHPMQTQAVSYMAQRFASLATLFYLLSFYLYSRARILNKNVIVLFGLAALSALLGMFTKQITITLPFMIVLFEFMFQKKRDEGTKIQWKYLIGVLLFLLIVPAIFKFNVLGILSIKHNSGSHRGDALTNYSYLLTQFRVICTYFKLMIFPIGQNLLYDFPTSYSIFESKTFWCFSLLFGLLVTAIRCLKVKPLLAFAIFWVFIALSVESSIIVIKHVIFEHRMYLPSFGFFLACSIILVDLFHSRKKCVVVMCLMAMTLSVLTYQRNFVWTDDVRMWEDVIAKSPQKSRPYMNLGIAYVQRSQWNKALPYLNQALERNSRNYAAYSNRGMAYFAVGQKEKALKDFNQALDIKDSYLEAYINRGNYYSFIKDYSKAIADYNRALELNPNSIQAILNRGNKYFHMKEYDKALKDYSKSLDIQPTFVQGYTSRGELYARLKKFDLAFDDFNQALELDNKNPKAFYWRGSLHFKKGNLHLALNDYNRVLEINPNHPNAMKQKKKLLYFIDKQTKKDSQ